jgi:hypothetical protein
MSDLAIDDELRATVELAAMKSELVGAITRQIDFYVAQMGLSKTEAAERARSLSPFANDVRPANQVSWNELAKLLEHDHDQGHVLWQRLRQEASDELTTGMRAARAVERTFSSPWDRAQFGAIVRALTTSLAPRDHLETLLVQQIAIAYDRYLRWQGVATRRTDEDEWEGDRDRKRAIANMSPQQRERYELDHGWMPPRVSTAEAIDQAVMIADRYQRSFLRLLKAFRDTRRLVGTVVLNGGQLNVAEQQMVTGPGPTRRVEPGPRAKRRRVRDQVRG